MRSLLRALVAASVALGLMAVLSGCALPRMIDSDVQSYTGASAAVRPATYRFERLPSQSQAPKQEALEAMAARALERVDLTPVGGGSAEAAPRYGVQVTARMTVMRVNTAIPPMGGFWWRHGGLGADLFLEPDWYRHEVRFLLRELSTGQVVYETSAIFDGPWSDSSNLLPPMMQAALQDYPAPPAGPRIVTIELPGGPAPAP